MLKYIINIFRKRKKKLYHVLIIRDGVLAIISSEKIQSSIEKYNINPVDNSKLICILELKCLPLHRMEKKMLSKTGAIYFFDNQDNKISTYKEVYEKVRNIKK